SERISGGKIRRDRIEVITADGRLEQSVATHVDGAGRMRRQEKRRRPVEAVPACGIRRGTRANCCKRLGYLRRFRFGGVAASDDDGVFENAGPITPTPAQDDGAGVLADVDSRRVSTLRLAVDDVWIVRIDVAVKPV